MSFLQQISALNGGRGPDASAPRRFDLCVTDPVEKAMFSGIVRMHERHCQHPHTAERKADNYKLYQLLDDTKHQGKKISYTYDFGDCSTHYMTIEGRDEATRDFQIISGTGHYVAEDVGSVRGWKELKDAYRVTHPTEEQKEKCR